MVFHLSKDMDIKVLCEVCDVHNVGKADESEGVEVISLISRVNMPKIKELLQRICEPKTGEGGHGGQ